MFEPHQSRCRILQRNLRQDPPLMCTRRPKNIRDKVVRADLGSHKSPLTRTLMDQKRTGTFPCLNCMSCSNIIKDVLTHCTNSLNRAHFLDDVGVPDRFRSPDRLWPYTALPDQSWQPSLSIDTDCVCSYHLATNAGPPNATSGPQIHIFVHHSPDSIWNSGPLWLDRDWAYILAAPTESMSTETYVYDDATGSTILSKIKTKTDFLHLPSKDAKSRDSERERKRLIGYDLHCATLGEYHRQGKIPRGLRCNLRPTLFSENEKYCATFQKILNKCSFDIILLTIEYLQEAIKATEEKIESIETQLTSTLNSTEFTTLKNKVDSILTVHQKTLEDRKRTKFQRDIEDYLTNNVYKWEDPFPRRPRPRYRRTPGNYHSGGSSPAGGSSAGSGSETELKVLNMGLSFCPTPKWDSFQLERDLQQFYRNIRLKVYFEESTNFPGPVSTPAQTEGPILTIDQLGLRNRSTFVPPKSSHAVETFVNLLDRDVKRTLHDQRLGFLPVRHNLDPLEKQALDSLSGNKNIIIKPADKGGAIVVMDKSFYMTEVRRQLSDTSTYKMLQTDPTYSIQQKIKKVLDKHLLLKTIDNKTKVYLTNNHPVTL
ncbi:unnamed protein product [Ranitomeya imitator]|uniref:Uncharacterized protein n=1 Tax=Ranitomeya imitator TaxID=111125 RepID=A0ABN9LXU1_9NEOB|nr:unnamed protein product [Ranitomeya imitator]